MSFIEHIQLENIRKSMTSIAEIQLVLCNVVPILSQNHIQIVYEDP
jgi:hypothetical protein